MTIQGIVIGLSMSSVMMHHDASAEQSGPTNVCVVPFETPQVIQKHLVAAFEKNQAIQNDLKDLVHAYFNNLTSRLKDDPEYLGSKVQKVYSDSLKNFMRLEQEAGKQERLYKKFLVELAEGKISAFSLMQFTRESINLTDEYSRVLFRFYSRFSQEINQIADNRADNLQSRAQEYQRTLSRLLNEVEMRSSQIFPLISQYEALLNMLIRVSDTRFIRTEKIL